MKIRVIGLIGVTVGVATSGVFLRQAESAPAPANGMSIVVDLSARELTVESGEGTIAAYPVAIGAPSYPTPKGDYRIRHIVWNPRWVPPDSKWARKEQPRPPGDPKNPMGRVKLFFREPDYYIHGTRDTDSLGQAESHGCIRLRNADAIALAKVVMNHGGSARPPGWFRRVLNRVSSTQEVFLSDPVAVRIVS
jgi:lipoprotein-anchoring transpeptidase ErfK/SrfK